jgi:Cu+-exporting ATPase
MTITILQAQPVEAADGRVITNPVRYTDDAPQQVEVTAPAAVAQPSGTHATVYTCPMHPQIRQPGPGTCPICGMALEPEMPSLEEDDNQSYAISPEVLVDVAFDVDRPGLGHAGTPSARLVHAGAHLDELVLSAPVVLWAGWPFFERCLQSIGNRSQHVDADRHRRGRRVWLQRGGHRGTRTCFRTLSASMDG